MALKKIVAFGYWAV